MILFLSKLFKINPRSLLRWGSVSAMGLVTNVAVAQTGLISPEALKARSDANADTLKPLSVVALEGTYAGTFLCESGEMGMSLTFVTDGPARIEDLGEMPCKSGAGPCNDWQEVKLKKRYRAKGVLNFFPTVSNPEAPEGVFKVKGTVKVGGYVSTLDLEPTDWIEQPDNFGASGLSARIINRSIYGKPTFEGCYTLKMRKLNTLIE